MYQSSKSMHASQQMHISLFSIFSAKTNITEEWGGNFAICVCGAHGGMWSAFSLATGDQQMQTASEYGWSQQSKVSSLS
mgnify:CR=1 FL=1